MGVLETKLMEYFNTTTNYKKLEDLVKLFKIDENNFEYFVDALANLEVNGFIYRDEQNRFLYFDSSDILAQGILKINPNGDGFIHTKNNKIVYIKKEDLGNAFEQDLIVVKKVKQNNKITYGEIDKIIRRKNEQTPFIYNSINNTLIPYKSNNKNSLIIDDLPLNLVDGNIVSINMNDMKYIEIIGHKDDPDLDIKLIACNYGFNLKFNDIIKDELRKIPTEVKEFNDRIDLRNKTIFTIDGRDTKDMDDAVSIELLDNGNYKLGVHIADVSHYIKRDSAIFKEAYARGTSLYIADSVIPMLPHQLSNGICSLNPNVDRLTKTCEMIIDQNGNIVDYNIYKSVINSKKKMSYEDINEIIENGNIVEGYEPFTNDLFLMKKLSEILNIKKENKHCLNFNIPELKFKGSNEEITFEKREQRSAEKLIENFMILANETVATHIYWINLPFLYRVHDNPDEGVIEEIIEKLNSFGLHISTCKNSSSNKYFQNIAKQIENIDDFAIYSELLRNGMKKAKYDSINYGHFGLASECYTHFTSPIRRLPDLIIHMLLDNYLVNNFIYADKLNKYLKEASIQASNREIAADKAEREGRLMMKAEYMENHIGDKYMAIIRAVSPHGMSVKTIDFFSGKISLCDMEDEFYYDSLHKCIIAKYSNIKFNIGDIINCEVAYASKENRTINFKNPQLIKNKVLSKS